MPDIVCGIPHGSVLGRTLFFTNINSISKLPLKGIIQLFVDDMGIGYFSTDKEQIKNYIEYDLILIKDWLNYQKLSLNVNKSNVMVISNVSDWHKLKLSIGKESLNKTNCIKYLGLLIDETIA